MCHIAKNKLVYNNSDFSKLSRLYNENEYPLKISDVSVGGAIIITLLYPLEYSKSYRKHNSFSVYSIVAKHKVPAADNKKKISEKVELL